MSVRNAPTRQAQVFTWVMVALPILIFYFILARWSFNLPLTDDTGPLLAIPLTLSELTSAVSKTQFFLAAQHNEYKLWLDYAVGYTQLQLLGHLNYRFLALLGDAVLLPIAYLLWRIFPRRTSPNGLLWFVPAIWVLFELSFWETLDWPMASLQNLCVVLFSFSIFALLVRRGRGAFALSILSGALAVASSGNGFIALIIGALLLFLRRRWIALSIWIFISGLLAWAYSYRYNVMASQVAQHRSVFVTLLHTNPLYPLAVLGSFAGVHLAVVAGVFCCVAVLYLLFSGFYRTHPVNGYCTLFVLLSALGIAGIRSELGFRLALGSRYRIYAALLLCLLWSAAADKLRDWNSRREHVALNLALILAVIFGLRFDAVGYGALHTRKEYVEEGARIYLLSLQDGTTRGPFLWSADQQPSLQGVNSFARDEYPKAMRAGVLLLPRPSH